MDKSLQIITLVACALFGWSANGHAQDADADVMVLSKDGKLSLSTESKSNTVSTPTFASTNLSSDTEDHGSVLRYAGILLILGGLAGWAWLAKRKKLTGAAKSLSTQGFEVMERLSLGAKRELLLVRTGPRVLVLASLETDLKLVTSIAQTDWLMHYDDQALLSIMEQAATRTNNEPAPRKTQRREERPSRPNLPVSKADNFDFSVFDKAMKKEAEKVEPVADWNWPTDKFEPTEKQELPARPERPTPPRKPASPRPGGLWESA